LFAKSWYDGLLPDLRGEVINDASNPGPYNWHINTRENWGEPWYAGFRKSQTLYRLKNQHYFRRNLMPGMLGWFQLTSETTLEDIQWLLARAAGFDAGFCITTSLESVKNNPHEREILAAVKAWESARNAHAFPEALLPSLQNIDTEYELSQASPRMWSITPITSLKFSVGSDSHSLSFKIPTYLRGSKLIVQVPTKVKLSHWSLSLDGQPLKPNWPEEIDGYRYLSIDLSNAEAGPHRLTISGRVVGAKDAALDCELRTPAAKPQSLTVQ